MEAVENVVRLADARRRKQLAQRAASSSDPAAQYFCLRCEHEEFRLYSSGTIHCAKCGALIRNINVAPKEPKEPAAS